MRPSLYLPSSTLVDIFQDDGWWLSFGFLGPTLESSLYIIPDSFLDSSFPIGQESIGLIMSF